MGIHADMNNVRNTTTKRSTSLLSPSSKSKDMSTMGKSSSSPDQLRRSPLRKISSCGSSSRNRRLMHGEDAIGESLYQDVRSLLEKPPPGSEKVASSSRFSVNLKKGSKSDRRVKAPPKRKDSYYDDEEDNDDIQQQQLPPSSPPRKFTVLSDEMRDEYEDQIEALKKQLAKVESKKEKELTRIQEEAKKEKKALKAEVKAAHEVAEQYETSSAELEDNNRLIHLLREENEKIRIKNREMQRHVENLRINNQRLSQTTQGGDEYYRQLEYHHRRLESDHAKLSKAEDDIQTKVTELQQEVQQVTNQILVDHYAMACYQRGIAMAFKLVMMLDDVDEDTANECPKTRELKSDVLDIMMDLQIAEEEQDLPKHPKDTDWGKESTYSTDFAKKCLASLCPKQRSSSSSSSSSSKPKMARIGSSSTKNQEKATLSTKKKKKSTSSGSKKASNAKSALQKKKTTAPKKSRRQWDSDSIDSDSDSCSDSDW